MSFDEKTMVMAGDGSSSIRCMLCGTPMVCESGGIRCPGCGYSKKSDRTIDTGSVVGGKYRILNPLGSGGCGDIFLCYPLSNPSTRYALKIRKACSSKADSQRFEREAMMLQQLNENRVIVDIIDYWSEDEMAFIVLEYINGQNLKDARKKYDFDEYMTLQVAHEVCLALKFAWDKVHLVHRDIKPANIMLDQEGYIRLLDFGMSKSLDACDSTVTVQQTGLGTPGYMSPEQYQQAKTVDFRSDLFSLGATMIFALTGHKPFHGENYIDCYRDTMAHTPPDETLLPSNLCSPECASLIRSLMAKNPDERPGSYDVVLQEIRALLARFN